VTGLCCPVEVPHHTCTCCASQCRRHARRAPSKVLCLNTKWRPGWQRTASAGVTAVSQLTFEQRNLNLELTVGDAHLRAARLFPAASWRCAGGCAGAPLCCGAAGSCAATAWSAIRSAAQAAVTHLTFRFTAPRTAYRPEALSNCPVARGSGAAARDSRSGTARHMHPPQPSSCKCCSCDQQRTSIVDSIEGCELMLTFVQCQPQAVSPRPPPFLGELGRVVNLLCSSRSPCRMRRWRGL
jgi:hypothetical protein